MTKVAFGIEFSRVQSPGLFGHEVFTSPEATPAMLCEEIGRLCGLEARECIFGVLF